MTIKATNPNLPTIQNFTVSVGVTDTAAAAPAGSTIILTWLDPVFAYSLDTYPAAGSGSSNGVTSDTESCVSPGAPGGPVLGSTVCPAGTTATIVLDGTPGQLVISWYGVTGNPPAYAPSNADAFLYTLNIPGWKGGYNPVHKLQPLAPAASGGGWSTAKTLAVIGGGVAVTGLGMALVGVLTDNGPGWLFGLAAGEAREAAETVRRSSRR